MGKKNCSSLKLKIENTFYKEDASSPHAKTLIKNHELIKNQEINYDEKEEDLILTPYREGDNEAVRYFSLQDLKLAQQIIGVRIMVTNCFSYHDPKTFNGYINKLNKIKKNKTEENYFIEITPLNITPKKEEGITFLPMNEKEIKEDEKSIVPFNKKRKIKNNIKVLFNKRGDDIKVTLHKDPNYIYFIIIKLENNKIYVFDPFSNRTLKHYSKKKDSYLNKLNSENKKAMVAYHHKSIFENNSNRFRKILVYELNSYEIISRIFDCMNEHSKINIDLLLQILKEMQSQSNKCYDVSNVTNAEKDNSSNEKDQINKNEDLPSKMKDEPSATEILTVQNSKVKIEENGKDLNLHCIFECLNEYSFPEDRVIKCNDVIIFGKKYYNGIYINEVFLFWDSTLWDKIESLGKVNFIGHYEKSEDDHIYLVVDGIKVARYDNDLKEKLEILNETVLMKRINAVERLLTDPQ